MHTKFKNNQEEYIMSVKHIGKEQFEEVVLNSPKKVFVDFYADWCGPCQMLAPVVEELSSKMEDVEWVKINVDEQQELAVKYNIMSIPALFVFENGKPVATHVGYASEAEIVNMLG